MILNEQWQSNDVLAEQELVVDEATGGVVSATTAVGNSVTAETEHQNQEFTSEQGLSASVQASSFVQTRGTSGEVLINNTSATGNTGFSSTCCGFVTGEVKQTIDPGAVVSSHAFTAAGGPVDAVAAGSTAIGNSQGYAAVNGDVYGWTTQRHYGTTNAYNQAVLCCVPGSGSFTATAVANNVTSEVENGRSEHGIDQVADGYETRATNDVYVVTGTDIAGVATATANNAHLYNTGGYAEVASSQANTAPVTAEALTTLEHWYGTGSSIAYGVGNSLYLANVSPDPVMRTEQYNHGDITGSATFDGGYGDDAFVSSTAIGNAVSGYACNSCYGIIDSQSTQVNNGAVRSTARIHAGPSRYVTGTSTAIGNSASYQSSGQ